MRDNSLRIPGGVLRNSGGSRFLWVLGAALLAAALLLYVLSARSQRDKVARYRSAPVERRTVVQKVEATARLDVAARIEVPTPVTGQLEEIEVLPGARVKRGQVLARLAEGVAMAELRGARAEEAAARSNVAEARATARAASERRERVQQLATRGLSSRRDLEAARAEERRAAAAVSAALAQASVAAEKVRASSEQKELRTLAAPSDGVVLVAPEDTGAIVSPEQPPLFVLGSSLDEMRLDAEVAEADIGRLKPGQRAEFSVPAFPGRTFEARVERVQLDGRREGAGVVYPVTLSAENPEHDLLPGMTATLHVDVARAEGVLAVREAALRFTPEDAPAAPSRSRVFRTEDGTEVEAVSVVTGLSDGAYTQVKPKNGDLEAGDRIVVGIVPRSSPASQGPGISLGRRQ